MNFILTMTILLSSLTIGKQAVSQESGTGSDLIGTLFPSVKVKSLSGKMIHYPDSMKGKVTLIMIAFEQDTQKKIDTWLEPFAEKYEKTPDVTFYEIPMLKRRWKLMSRIIDGGMRSGIQEDRHDFVSTYYGDIDKYRRLLNMEDKSDAFLFLLDKNGMIQWHDTGSATEAKLDDLYTKAEKLRLMDVKMESK